MSDEHLVSQRDSGASLLQFLQRNLQGRLSGRGIKKMLEQGACKVNGKQERFASRKLRVGERVRFDSEHPLIQKPKHADLSRIVFEDEHILVYDKPAGLASDKKGLFSQLKELYPTLLQVHRLDRDTSGLIMFSKTQEAYDGLGQQFRDRKILKEYWCIVEGKPDQKMGSIKTFLEKKSAFDGQTIYGVARDKERGRIAITQWEVKATGQESSLLICYPKTGRTHQIRVHLCHLGHPILGDYQYHRRFTCSFKTARHLLHARKLNFQHPVSNEPMELRSELAADFREAMNQLGLTGAKACKS